MRKVAVVVGSVILGCGCSASQPGEPASFIAAKTAVKRQLRDPDSAMFEDLRVNGRRIVCGMVNSRNAFGGYAGRTGFWYNPTSDEAEVAPINGNERLEAAHTFALQGCEIGPDQATTLDAWRELQPAAAAERLRRRIQELANGADGVPH